MKYWKSSPNASPPIMPNALEVTGQANLAENAFSQVDQDRFTSLAAKMIGVSLLALGKLRAFAQLDRNIVYRTHSPQADAQIAEPLVKLAELGEALGFEPRPTAGGTWQLVKGRPTMGSGPSCIRRRGAAPSGRRA